MVTNILAIGEYNLKFIKMPGRIIIDMCVIFRKEFTLSFTLTIFFQMEKADEIVTSLEVEASFDDRGESSSLCKATSPLNDQKSQDSIFKENTSANASTENLALSLSESSNNGPEMHSMNQEEKQAEFKVCEMDVPSDDQGDHQKSTSGVITDGATFDMTDPVTDHAIVKSEGAINEEELAEPSKTSVTEMNRKINRQKFNDQHAVYDHRCPISSETMLNPVVADDGITYERCYIEEWFDECAARGLPFTSPATAETIQPILKENNELKSKDFSAYIDNEDLKDIPSIHKLRAVFAELDPLREFLSETLRGWQPPQFVVIGQESSGKSTLLERLTTMPIFPHHDSCCTRMPLHVRLRHSDKLKAPRLEVFNVATSTTEEGPYIIPMRWAAVEVKQKMLEILESEGNPHGVSTTRIIILTVAGPRMPSIDLVDMPGLVSSPSDLKDQTRLLLQQHIARHEKYSMFLVTVPGDTSPNISIAMDVIQEMSLQEKTLGVFTMCDDIQPRKQDVFKERLHQLPCDTANGHSANLLHRGWVATMNAPNHGDMDFLPKIQQQANAESEFFSKNMPDLDPESVTCRALVSRMNEMYTNHLKATWAPTTIDLIECAYESAQEQNSQLGLPDFHENIDEAQDLAVIEARSILDNDLTKIVQDCCRLILQPLQSTLSDQFCESSSFDKPESVCGWISDQRTLILSVCNKAASEIEQFFLSGLETSLMNSASSSFRLTRFPNFLNAILSNAKVVLKTMVESLASTITSCTDTFFGEMSPWVSIKLMTDSKQVAVNVSCKSDVLVENIIFSFIRHLPCQGLVNGLSETAAGVENWVESCQEVRAEVQNRLQRLKAAEKGIASLLDVDLSAMLEERLRVKIKLHVFFLKSLSTHTCNFLSYIFLCRTNSDLQPNFQNSNHFLR